MFKTRLFYLLVAQVEVVGVGGNGGVEAGSEGYLLSP